MGYVVGALFSDEAATKNQLNHTGCFGGWKKEKITQKGGMYIWV